MNSQAKEPEVPDKFVMDAMANDIESIDDLMRSLNSSSALGWTDVWGRMFTRDEIVSALMRLVRAGLVNAYAMNGEECELVALDARVVPQALSEAYFGLTDRGRILHANLDYPDGPAPTR